MTHAAMSPEARAQAGISDGLLRLSVGIEALADLQADLAAALARAQAAIDGATRKRAVQVDA
jgi:cystathionine gamma-synthase